MAECEAKSKKISSNAVVGALEELDAFNRFISVVFASGYLSLAAVVCFCCSSQ